MIVLGKDFKEKLYHVFPKGVSSYEDTPFKQPTHDDNPHRITLKSKSGEGCWVSRMDNSEGVPEWLPYASDFRDYSGTIYYAEVIPADDAKILIIDEDAIRLFNDADFQFNKLSHHVDMVYINNYDVMSSFGLFGENFTDKMNGKYENYPSLGFYGWDIISGVWLNEKFTVGESVAVNYTDKAPEHLREIEEKIKQTKEEKKLKKKREEEFTKFAAQQENKTAINRLLSEAEKKKKKKKLKKKREEEFTKFAAQQENKTAINRLLSEAEKKKKKLKKKRKQLG